MNGNTSLYNLAKFLRKHRHQTILWLNQNEFSDIPATSSLEELNYAVAENMNDGEFIDQLSQFIKNTINAYQNWIVTVATIVIGLTTAVASANKEAKAYLQAQIQGEMGARAGYHLTEEQKLQAQIQGQRVFALQLSQIQQAQILSEEEAVKNRMQKKTFMGVGIIIFVAIAIPIIINYSKKIKTK